MPLLHTCAQIRREAIGIFYAENTFKVVFTPGGTEPLAAWLDLIGERNIQLLNRLLVVIDCSELIDATLHERFGTELPRAPLAVSQTLTTTSASLSSEWPPKSS